MATEFTSTTIVTTKRNSSLRPERLEGSTLIGQQGRDHMRALLFEGPLPCFRVVRDRVYGFGLRESYCIHATRRFAN